MFCGLAAALLTTLWGQADAMIETKDQETGWTVYKAVHGSTSLTLVPEAGCNTLSIRFREKEILRQPKSVKELRGYSTGNPILYPMPNRVRDSVFSFGGRKYQFTANDRTHFLHGLVHSVPWKLLGVESQTGRTTFRCQLDFAPPAAWFELFPHKHTLKLDVSVSEGVVRYTYTVENSDSGPLPFGFALHPWFLYQGRRESTYLTVPATHWMEAEALLPTAKLVDLAGSKFDARKPISLSGFVIDDVYFGMTPENPAVIDFRDKKLRITLKASADFTHLVVYTPADQPWFCVENQTCSTDAHNLYARGFVKESHLQIVDPDKSASGWIEYRLEEY
jgi:aldose 1-epimerase